MFEGFQPKRMSGRSAARIEPRPVENFVVVRELREGPAAMKSGAHRGPQNRWIKLRKPPPKS
jgi:hypothetical protein